jgi:oligopeptide transport system permease protein
MLFFLLTVTFVLLRLLPGGPFDSASVLPPEVKAHLESHYHLNDPLFIQYFVYLKNLLSGDWGTSLRFLDQDIGEILMASMGPTVTLGILSLLFSFSVGIILGLLSKGRMVMNVLTLAMSVPTFLMAPFLILIFSFKLDILPAALWMGPRYFILPVITLSLRPTALIARLVRSSKIEYENSDFVRAARAKGVFENKILFKHVLRNSLIPLLGTVGPMMAHVLSGSFVIEILFAIPGLGHHFVDSVLDRDYTLVMALTLLYGTILSLSNLVVDLVSVFIDPRLQYEK